MLVNVSVSDAIAKGQAERFKQAELTAENILRAAAALAFSNIQDLVDEDGNLLPIKDWPRDAAAAVQGVEVTKRNLVAGDGLQEDVLKIRLWDKPANIQVLMKHLGLLKEGVTFELGDNFIALINAARRRFQDAKQLRGGEE